METSICTQCHTEDSKLLIVNTVLNRFLIGQIVHTRVGPHHLALKFGLVHLHLEESQGILQLSGNSTTFRKGLTGFVDTPKYGSVTWILTTSSNMLYQSSRTTSSRIYSPISTLKPSLKDLAASSSMILTSPIEHSCKYQKRICLRCWEAWALFWVPTESKTARPNTASIGGHCVGSHLIHILCCLSPVLSIHLQILECC